MRWFVLIFFTVSPYVHSSFNNEEYIDLPKFEAFSEFPEPAKSLTCIGEVIDFSKLNNKFWSNNLVLKSLRNYSPDIFWQNISFDKELDINGIGRFIYLGQGNENLYWSGRTGNARLNVTTGKFVATDGRIQLQVVCKHKHKNWNEFGN